jgi:ribosomal protein S19
MSRSLYKLPFVHRSIFKNCLDNKSKKKGQILNEKKIKNIPHYLYFWKKNSLINNNLLFKKIGVYNGKVFLSLNVAVPFIGYKLGQFCITRIKPPHRGKQKQKKKVQKTIFDKTPASKIVIERLKKMKKI